MKRWGTVTLMLVAFVAGFVSTYSCGGGTSSSAADYAPLIHTHDAGDITGTIDADSVGGLDGTFIRDLWESTCLLYAQTGVVAPATIHCDSFQKKVFITSSTYTGNLGGLAAADAVCQNAASSAGLAGTYLAWLSDSTTAVNDTFTKSAHPYVLVDGTVVAWNWEDLTDGTINSAIDLDAYGAAVVGRRAWTGTYETGEKYSNNSIYLCYDWTIGTSPNTGTVGWNSYTDARWTSEGNGDCANSYSLYCFEQ